MNLSDKFVPKNAGTAVADIAEELFYYYEQSDDEDGSRLKEVENEEDMLALLTPAVCQEYVDRMQACEDDDEGEDSQFDKEQQVMFDVLVLMGVLAPDAD
jgi:hypothetical protein